IGWKPLHLLNSVGTSVAAVLQPAGLEKSIGIVSAGYQKDPTDPHWRDDPGFQEWLAWMKAYNPEGDPLDASNVTGYSVSQTLVQVLTQCADDLTRENVMKQAANLKDLKLPMLLPGIKINTGPTNFFPIRQMQLRRFDGKSWVPFGNIMEG